MNRERTNRVVFAVLGTVLLAAGAYALLRSFGALGSDDQHAPVLLHDLRDWVHQHVDGFRLLGALACLVIALAALAWLWLQRPRSLPADDVVYDDTTGSTSVSAGAIEDAVAADLEAQSVVDSARVGLRQDEESTLVVARLAVADGTSAATVAHRVVRPALARYRQATERDNITARVVVDYVDGDGSAHGHPGAGSARVV